ncbi:hypothetical protein CTI12_AA093800 [Artemisia annua]|uniref:Uncharacterized protein n=1 Tax=Artemisia annua TaxID=35608 RepID=A0A2U1PZG4_ARTAN|nr:hypothetical protein CTI12_AA093800 [Artemisia annua]
MATKSVEILKVVGARGGVVTRTVENGVVRMKILVKRQELKQVLEQVTQKRDDNKENKLSKGNNHRKLSRSLASKSLEPQLDDSKENKNVKSDQVNRDCRSYWRPALQSIPEEF